MAGFKPATGRCGPAMAFGTQAVFRRFHVSAVWSSETTDIVIGVAAVGQYWLTKANLQHRAQKEGFA